MILEQALTCKYFSGFISCGWLKSWPYLRSSLAEMFKKVPCDLLCQCLLLDPIWSALHEGFVPVLNGMPKPFAPINWCLDRCHGVKHWCAY